MAVQENVTKYFASFDEAIQDFQVEELPRCHQQGDEKRVTRGGSILSDPDYCPVLLRTQLSKRRNRTDECKGVFCE